MYRKICLHTGLSLEPPNAKWRCDECDPRTGRCRFPGIIKMTRSASPGGRSPMRTYRFPVRAIRDCGDERFEPPAPQSDSPPRRRDADDVESDPASSAGADSEAGLDSRDPIEIDLDDIDGIVELGEAYERHFDSRLDHGLDDAAIEDFIVEEDADLLAAEQDVLMSDVPLDADPTDPLGPGDALPFPHDVDDLRRNERVDPFADPFAGEMFNPPDDFGEDGLAPGS